MPEAAYASAQGGNLQATTSLQTSNNEENQHLKLSKLIVSIVKSARRYRLVVDTVEGAAPPASILTLTHNRDSHLGLHLALTTLLFT